MSWSSLLHRQVCNTNITGAFRSPPNPFGYNLKNRMKGVQKCAPFLCVLKKNTNNIDFFIIIVYNTLVKKFFKGEIVLKKRVLSGLLAIALIFGSAAALPEGVFETSSTIRASADSYVYGDFFYELSENGKFVMITKYIDKTSTTCTIPDTIDDKPVEIIAHAAFRDHTELEKVVFPKSLRGIANVAFKGCTSLRELDLPDSLTQISESAFEGCTYLESVTIPKGVKTIGKNAFANCECLDSVTIQDGVGGIGVGAFSGCPWLSNITIPGSVKTIAVNAFNKCINLERVTISDGVEFIGAYAFTGCPGLSRLVIPKSVKTIGKDNTAYPYSEDNPICDKDKCSIACYPGSNALTYAAFNGYKIEYISGDYIYKELKDETVEITGYLGKDKALTIPSELAEKKVSGIGNGAFANMSDLTSVTIPKGVKSIGDSAFAMCKSLKSITIPSSVTSIGNSAFRYCWSLTSVTIPNSVTNIGNFAFADCDSLTSVTIPGSVKSIGYYAFSGCESLTSVTIPSSIKIINSSMFDDCSSLTSVTIPDSVTTIKGGAFAGCSSLKSITIPKSVTSIDHVALGYDYDDDHMLMVNPDFIVRCYKDSAAEKYAKDNNLKIEYITAKHVAAKKATCTTDGNIEYWKYGNKYYSDKELTKQIDESKIVIKATGHKWGEPTWTWNGVKSATAKFVCAKDKSHVETVTAKITSKTTKATCEKDGKTVYTATVTFGGKTYTDTKTVTIKKTGHKYGEPTWTWNGVKSATAKFVCAKDKSHVETVTAKITSKTTKAATCTTDGKAVYTATVTLDGKTYTDKKTVTIKKLGHKYGEPTWTWNGVKSATAKFVCAKDKSHVETVTAKITSKTTKATCEKDGKTVYTATVTFGGKTYTTTKTVTIKKLGHKYGEPTWTWNGTKTASAKFVCANDKSHVETVKAKITSKTTKATCEKDGKTVYTATVTFNGNTYTDTKTVTITKTGHKFSAWKTTGFDFAKKTSTQTRKCSVCGKTETQTTKNAIERLAGANRYETASVISTKMYPKSSGTVIIATGLTFHDAMVAVPLASAYNAPLLLATEKHITAQTEAELKRLKAKNVIVVSTNGAIGSGAKAELKALGLRATYIEGKNVFETSTKVAKALQTKTKTAPDTIFFATDSAFADALSASPVAAIKGAPIIYLNNKSIDKTVAEYLKSVKGKIKNAYIIGGNGVISDAMMKNVANALGLTVNKTVQRVAGANRYETCVAVNNKFKSVLSSDGICVAKGLDFPDALAGGVYAASTKQALFLADGKKLQDCQNTYLKGKNAAKITVFGGTGAVPDELVKLIAQASV